MTEAYDGRQVVGIDLHRRRSATTCMPYLAEPSDSGRDLAFTASQLRSSTLMPGPVDVDHGCQRISDAADYELDQDHIVGVRRRSRRRRYVMCRGDGYAGCADPVPSRDFDPTEAGVSWRVLTDLGHRVVFATPDGHPAESDQMMLTGEGLDPWARLAAARRVIVAGRAVRADARGRIAYSQMVRSPEFAHPIAWEAICVAGYDGLLLPGGHRARGMREYLESARLHEVVVEAFGRGMPVAAICHGVLLAARSTDPATGRSVLHGRRTTSLTWSQERQAWRIGRVIRFWDPDYFRTYVEEPGQPAGYMSVQAEVTRALARPEDYQDVPTNAPDARRKRAGLHRDSLEDARPAFVVRDGNYLSARWPGDAHTFAKQFSAMLEKVPAPSGPAAPDGGADS